MSLTRRRFLQDLLGLCGLGVLPAIAGPTSAKPILRSIPVSGELFPVIGMGSWLTFDVDDDAELREVRRQVLQTFFHHGGAMVDSSPMYGSSEEVIGYCLRRLGYPKQLFSATKVWTWTKQMGIQQMLRSQKLWGVKKFDLMQIHNMLDWETHLETLRQWKEEGRIRYIGITTSHGRRHSELEQALRREDFDFVQFTYNVLDRETEQRLLPLAAERGTAVIINRPFQGGRLFGYVGQKPLPSWGKDYGIENWAQFFLKFIVSHPAVTCAIPATSRVDHMQQNMGALYGALPGEKIRRQMIRYMENL